MRPLALAVLAILVNSNACTKPQKSMRLPQITSEQDEGFQDLVFAVSGHYVGPSGDQKLRATGRHSTQIVAFDVHLGPEWTERQLEGVDAQLYAGSVTLSAVGPESDALVSAVDDLYGTHLSPAEMKRETEFAALSLEGDPKKLESGPCKLKLFFESEDENRYAEVYLNIDLARSRVGLAEKDEEYRRPLLLALTEPLESSN
ncbi:MAG: hypothetical protein WBN10_14765 [Polyangiales bacterium]|jgi:hypothetical protein